MVVFSFKTDQPGRPGLWKLTFRNNETLIPSFLFYFIYFQLLDFRQVLARLLGLDVETLSVPDYEIISRLERLVQAHHAHSITTHSLETSLQDMECGFRAGYDDAVAILRTPSPLKMK